MVRCCGLLGQHNTAIVTYHLITGLHNNCIFRSYSAFHLRRESTMSTYLANFWGCRQQRWRNSVRMVSGNLNSWLDAAKKNRENLTPYATEENLRHIEEKIDASEGLLDRLKRLRDQRIAHHDAIPAGDVSLLYGEVRKLVEEIKSVYNSLTSGHEKSVTHFEYLAREAERHTSEVVRLMREDRARAIQRIKKTDTAT